MDHSGRKIVTTILRLVVVLPLVLFGLYLISSSAGLLADSVILRLVLAILVCLVLPCLSLRRLMSPLNSLGLANGILVLLLWIIFSGWTERMMLSQGAWIALGSQGRARDQAQCLVVRLMRTMPGSSPDDAPCLRLEIPKAPPEAPDGPLRFENVVKEEPLRFENVARPDGGR